MPSHIAILGNQMTLSKASASPSGGVQRHFQLVSSRADYTSAGRGRRGASLELPAALCLR
jgi:hypothetical protein